MSLTTPLAILAWMLVVLTISTVGLVVWAAIEHRRQR